MEIAPPSAMPTELTEITGVTRSHQFEAARIKELASSLPFGRDYVLDVLLGRGATGVVFKARQRRSERPVAIKFFTGIAHATDAARFDQERGLLASLRHPNITEFIDAGELAGCPFVVLELAPGGSLKQRLAATGRLAPAEVLRIARDVLAGLEACHAAGVVHRDVKPANILLGAAGEAKLADLGAAKRWDQPAGLTSQGHIVGTPKYMAPEQLTGRRVDARADVYAVGMVLHELLTGETPFANLGIGSQLYARSTRLPSDPALGLTDVPPGLSRAILASLDPDPEKRPARAADLAALLTIGGELQQSGVRRSAPGRRAGASTAFPSCASFFLAQQARRPAPFSRCTALACALAVAVALLTCALRSAEAGERRLALVFVLVKSRNEHSVEERSTSLGRSAPPSACARVPAVKYAGRWAVRWTSLRPW